MKIEKYFWSLSDKGLENTRKILKDPENPRFPEKFIVLLNRSDDPKEIFGIIPRNVFVEKWPAIRNYWLRHELIPEFFSWWSTIYEQLAGKSGPKGNPSKAISNIAGAIRNARKEKGWTQSDLALRTGFDQAFISKMEKAKILNPEIETLIKIYRALGISEIRIGE